MTETERTRLRPVEESDFAALLEARRSNPQHLARTDGAGGVPGDYDQDMLARDVGVAEMDPARHIDVIELVADHRVVGFVDHLDENPADGHPWIGTVEVHAEHQRRGIGREVVTALVGAIPGRPVRGRTWDDDATEAFARSCGFAPVDGSTTWQVDR